MLYEHARAAQVAAAGCSGAAVAAAAGNGGPESSPQTGRRGRERCEEEAPGVDVESSTTGRSWR